MAQDGHGFIDPSLALQGPTVTICNPAAAVSNTEEFLAPATSKTHPAVRFWNKSDWEAWKKLPENYHADSTSYMEDDRGLRDVIIKEWPLLRLCNDGWKLEDLATITYPDWKRSNLNSNGTLKANSCGKKSGEADGTADDSENLGNEDGNEDEDEDNKPEGSSKKWKQKASSSKVKCELMSEISSKRAKSIQ
ncbi:hypothetical protein JVU11DRAFT_7123 [Chiua virens]|nr:hypothetical protein JVU11DRAFT_7123 [Chiua virens]